MPNPHITATLAILVAGSVPALSATKDRIDAQPPFFENAQAEKGISVKEAMNTNPFMQPWKTPYGAPPFSEIKVGDYLPAFQEGIDANRLEIEAIAKSKAKPTFANTLAPLAKGGELLAKVSNVFFNLLDAETSEALQELAEKIAPMLSAHTDDIYQNADLFKRVKAVYDNRVKQKLSPEEAMLLEETYKTFVRGGALLDEPTKARLRELNAELSLLGLKFSDNVLKETNAYGLAVGNEGDLAGLPESSIAAAAEEAKTRGIEGKWVFTLKGPSIWPFLQYCQNRELRKELLTEYSERCNKGGETDNKALMVRIAKLRVEKAKLLGHKTWAHFQHEIAMAKTPEGVCNLLNQLWPASLSKAKAERAELQAMFEADFPNEKLQAWDWRYYAERVKKAKYDLDEEELRPYLVLENVQNGAFEVCRRLFGITFHEVKNAPVYNSEVTAFEVKDADGSFIGLLFMDYHPRPSKRGGAWMNNYRDQWKEGKENIRPIVTNVGNYSRAAGDMPALLTMDEVQTLFHELGHGLHGLLSQCSYRPTSGTNTPIDFVELPSQIMENWAFAPEVLKLYARHWKTGEAMPQSLIDKIIKAETFNQGFATTEYLAASLLDMDWHTMTEAKDVDAMEFEKKSLEKMGMIPEILSRYRTTYFLHSATGYSASYYSYIWSQVLDSDAFQAFKDKGDVFDAATAKSFRKNILEAGGSRPAMEMYKSFRGAEPKVDPLLKRKGLK
jgi:peptidyl-dipeptidase Dcp